MASASYLHSCGRKCRVELRGTSAGNPSCIRNCECVTRNRPVLHGLSAQRGGNQAAWAAHAVERCQVECMVGKNQAAQNACTAVEELGCMWRVRLSKLHMGQRTVKPWRQHVPWRRAWLPKQQEIPEVCDPCGIPCHPEAGQFCSRHYYPNSKANYFRIVLVLSSVGIVLHSSPTHHGGGCSLMCQLWYYNRTDCGTDTTSVLSQAMTLLGKGCLVTDQWSPKHNLFRTKLLKRKWTYHF